MMFQDSDLKGTPLNFSEGLDIRGDTAFIELSNHYIEDLSINMKFAVCNIKNVKSQRKTVLIETGMYNEVVEGI